MWIKRTLIIPEDLEYGVEQTKIVEGNGARAVIDVIRLVTRQRGRIALITASFTSSFLMID